MLRKSEIIAFYAIGFFFSSVIAFSKAGYMINTSGSLNGWLFQNREEIPTKGMAVSFCPPDTEIFREARERHYLDKGFCHGEYLPLAKKIVAMEGDKVDINQGGIFVNGIRLNHSEPLTMDGARRKLEPFVINNYILKSDEFIVYGDAIPNSFDSRYFGVIRKEQIRSVIEPLF